MSEDFETRVQRKAEAHLAACNEALFEDGGELVESPAFGPYCGCDTCIVREVLMAVWDDFAVEATATASQKRRDDRHAEAELAAPAEWGDRG